MIIKKFVIVVICKIVQFDPNMGMMDIYVVENIQNVLNFDGNNNVRPMSQYVEDPQSVSGLFDSIAYEKCKLQKLSSH